MYADSSSAVDHPDGGCSMFSLVSPDKLEYIRENITEYQKGKAFAPFPRYFSHPIPGKPLRMSSPFHLIEPINGKKKMFHV